MKKLMMLLLLTTMVNAQDSVTIKVSKSDVLKNIEQQQQQLKDIFTKLEAHKEFVNQLQNDSLMIRVPKNTKER